MSVVLYQRPERRSCGEAGEVQVRVDSVYPMTGREEGGDRNSDSCFYELSRIPPGLKEIIWSPVAIGLD